MIPSAESLRMLISTGKVPRKPSLEQLDERVDKRTDGTELAAASVQNNALYRDYASTQHRDKALLISLGVDGNVPFDVARRNVGLNAVRTKKDGARHAFRMVPVWVPANTNELAAKAA